MPNEYSIVTIGFTPPLNTEVTATAICRIQGGAEEHLTVTGRSSKLRYSLDKQSVNLGNQVKPLEHREQTLNTFFMD